MNTLEERIAELEDTLKAKDRQIHDLKADLDKANDLIEREREYIEDYGNVIEAWKEAFDMQPTDAGAWSWAEWIADCERYREMYNELAGRWNRNIDQFNAVIAPRNIGRPLAASDTQRDHVLVLRRKGMSLRSIAEETNLGLSTVRTIIDQRAGNDRTTRKHAERIRRHMGEEREWRSRKRTRDALPRRIGELLERGPKLLKETKGGL